MKFKYNFLAISLLGAMAVSCDPMEDIYDEIDAAGSQITKVKEEYVLTDADYETISKKALTNAKTHADSSSATRVKTEKALNDAVTGKTYMPALLAKLYPSWGKESRVNVTYDFHKQLDGMIAQYQSISRSYIKNEQYDEIWAADGYQGIHFLSPKHAPEVVIPQVLFKYFPNAKENDKVLIEYKYDTVDPHMTLGEDLFSEDFATGKHDTNIDIEGWKQIHVEGKYSWRAKVYDEGDSFAQFSAFNSKGIQKVALITPSVNITKASANLTFDMSYSHYDGDALTVYITDNMENEDVFNFEEWKDITSEFDIASTNFPMKNCGSYSLANYMGKSVRFAFLYSGEDKKITSTVKLDNIKVTTTEMSESNEKTFSSFYNFSSGAWSLSSNKHVFVLTDEDYVAMGKPGDKGNFSSTIKIEDYLPNYLSQKLPYAINGNYAIVVYKFYNGKTTEVRADQFDFNNQWTLNDNIVRIEKETYIHNGKEWMYDPTIVVNFTESDYTYLVDWVKENKNAYWDDYYKNSEYWFGSSFKFKNFNVQLYKRHSNDPDGVIPEDEEKAKVYLIDQVAAGVLLVLEHNYPDASDKTKDGLDQYYNVVCKVYDGTDFRYTFKFKSLGGGKFKQEGEPVVEKW